MLSFASGPLVHASMRAQIPDQERPFRLPGGHTIPLLAFWGSNLIVYWSGWTTVWKLMIAVLIGFVLLAAFVGLGSDEGQVPRRPLGAVGVPLAGRAHPDLLPRQLPRAGGRQPATSSTSCSPRACCSLLSVGVYVMAYPLRLPDAEAQAYIDETVHEAAVEDKELSPPSP